VAAKKQLLYVIKIIKRSYSVIVVLPKNANGNSIRGITLPSFAKISDAQNERTPAYRPPSGYKYK